MKLNPNKGLKYTKRLVAVSMAGSILSVVTGMAGFGELYPFATWKLYTQPLGSKNIYEEYRIYTLAPDNAMWQRQSVMNNPKDFTQDEYVYTLNKLVAGALSDAPDSVMFRSRLQSFVKYVAPPAAAYKIVKETYHPLEHLHHPQHYDTLTVLRF
ncbi:hypothetical protein [Pontibacter sp. H249]|uniref:hypothetical protein n=1 Tax=Pontibacter sp. H249 TaxID=3133420 RepID=UPI0030BEB07A